MLELYGISSLVMIISYLWGVNRKRESLKSRVAVWFIVVQIIFLTCIMPQQLFQVFMIIVGLIGVCEVENNRQKSKLQCVPHLLIALLSMLGMLYLPQIMYYLLPIFVLGIGMVFWGKKEWVIGEQFTIIYEVCIISYGCMAMTFLHGLETRIFVLMMFLIQANDIAGYFVGSAKGKHYPFKNISPNKSVEGYISGLISICIFTMIVAKLMPEYRTITTVQWGMIVSCFYIVGNGGDLLFSAYKRKLGIKDFSQILKAHGGVMDRLDDILTLAPVLYIMVMVYSSFGGIK